MIQRIQTLYLGVAAVMLIVVAATMKRGGLPSDPAVTSAILLAGFLAVVVLATVFLFRHRKRQRLIVRLSRLGCWLLLLAIALTIDYGQIIDQLQVRKADHLVIAVLATFVALVLLQRASSAINRDIALIDSMDRIR